jgi:hypothetical protein
VPAAPGRGSGMRSFGQRMPNLGHEDRGLGVSALARLESSRRGQGVLQATAQECTTLAVARARSGPTGPGLGPKGRGRGVPLLARLRFLLVRRGGLGGWAPCGRRPSARESRPHLVCLPQGWW